MLPRGDFGLESDVEIRSIIRIDSIKHSMTELQHVNTVKKKGNRATANPHTPDDSMI
jgi:hypothetical protein